jgi:hypothetical protein
VPGCGAASIALSLEGRTITGAISARIALELDLAQYDSHDGPCLTSFRSMSTLQINIAEADHDFPHFTRAAQLHGVQGVLSAPALRGDDIVGTLNLYSRTGPFDETAEAIAVVLATQVALAISRSPEFVAARNVVEHAQRDLDDDAEIQVATGLLMVNEACTLDQPEGLLRSAASHDEQPILEIAVGSSTSTIAPSSRRNLGPSDPSGSGQSQQADDLIDGRRRRMVRPQPSTQHGERRVARGVRPVLLHTLGPASGGCDAGSLERQGHRRDARMVRRHRRPHADRGRSRRDARDVACLATLRTGTRRVRRAVAADERDRDRDRCGDRDGSPRRGGS